MDVFPLDLSRLKVFPLAQRKSLTRVDDILVDPDSTPKPCSDANAALIRQCVRDLQAARKRDAAVILVYGAHLLRNGAARILERMMAAVGSPTWRPTAPVRSTIGSTPGSARRPKAWR